MQLYSTLAPLPSCMVLNVPKAGDDACSVLTAYLAFYCKPTGPINQWNHSGLVLSLDRPLQHASSWRMSYHTHRLYPLTSSLCFNLSFCFPFSCCLSFTFSLFPSLSLSFSLSLCPCFSVSLSLFLSLSLCFLLAVSFSLSLYLHLSLSLSLSLCHTSTSNTHTPLVQ